MFVVYLDKCALMSRGAVLLIQRNLTPCAGKGINRLLSDGADAHTTLTPRPRPLSAEGVVAAVAPVTPEATHVRAVLVEVLLLYSYLEDIPEVSTVTHAKTTSKLADSIDTRQSQAQLHQLSSHFFFASRCAQVNEPYRRSIGALRSVRPHVTTRASRGPDRPVA